ncbi:MAG TPA: ADOP family duplicated permease, partial [Bryobacteraceae bacterium]|nr:ADOP family duplicated permease [Bryobacteraceae bacterium]
TLAIIGRLKPGAAAGSARAELRILARQMAKAHPERNEFEGYLMPLASHVNGRLRIALYVLAGAVGMVMLIVCANLSNLLLARAASRQKELAVRAALGAGRARLMRQMLTESLALSCAGAALGALLATLGTRLVAHLDAVSIPLLHDVRMDFSALGFILAAAILTGLVFGLAPALHTQPGALYEALKDATRGSTRGRSGLRGALVVAEVAFACVLLVSAGLLVRSFLRVLDVDLGFQPARAAALRVDPDSHMPNRQFPAYFADVLRRARAVPGVEAAGLSDALPLGRNRSWGAGVKGQTYPPGRYPDAFVRVVSDGYIGAMGIPLREGRDLSEHDDPNSAPVIMINETMARTLFPGHSALGGVILACGERRVVGVVGDVRHLALEQGSGMEMYLPIRQCNDFSSVDLVVRTHVDPTQLAAPVRAALAPIAPDLPGKDFRILQSLVDKAVSPRRFVVLLLGGFAAFALVLASLGIYAVVSYSVNQRTQEIGIRMALGASAVQLQADIVSHSLRLAAAGILLGAAASWLLARALAGLLYGITPGDPATFLGMALVLAAVAAIAGYLPAFRASRIDPASALRAS